MKEALKNLGILGLGTVAVLSIFVVAYNIDTKQPMPIRSPKKD